MNNYTENDTFGFGTNQEDSSMNQNSYENVDMFNTEVYENGFNNSFGLANEEMSSYSLGNNVFNNEMPLNNNSRHFDLNVFESNLGDATASDVYQTSNVSSIVPTELENSEEVLKEELLPSDVIEQTNNDDTLELKQDVEVFENIEPVQDEPAEVESLNEKDNSFDKKTEELTNEINSQSRKIQMSDEDLTALTTFKEDKVEETDIKALFDRVGINVKEASDVFRRNTEMKEKLDSRFEELKKLQLEVARRKEEQYTEINAYKDEVLNKLTEKKEEIEKRLNKLKEYQASLEKEKEEFEQYRKKEKEEIERVQREVQEAYDNRREELSHIEDVLRRQKDLLDEERNQLSLDKIQYESDKNELANNLLKFNEIVGSFTSGIDKIDKE